MVRITSPLAVIGLLAVVALPWHSGPRGSHQRQIVMLCELWQSRLSVLLASPPPPPPPRVRVGGPGGGRRGGRWAPPPRPPPRGWVPTPCPSASAVVKSPPPRVGSGVERGRGQRQIVMLGELWQSSPGVLLASPPPPPP